MKVYANQTIRCSQCISPISISGKVLGHRTQKMRNSMKKVPLFTELATARAPNTQIVQMIVALKWMQKKTFFSLDFELNWRHIIVYLLVQMVNPSILRQICLIDPRFRTLEIACDLTFWLRFFFLLINTLNYYYISSLWSNFINHWNVCSVIFFTEYNRFKNKIPSLRNCTFKLWNVLRATEQIVSFYTMYSC